MSKAAVVADLKESCCRAQAGHKQSTCLGGHKLLSLSAAVCQAVAEALPSGWGPASSLDKAFQRLSYK